jgi:hypothetical protein
LLRTGSNSHEPTSNGATTERLRAALHPMNSDQKIWPLEHFHQLVQDDALVIPGPRFSVFFQNALGVTNSLKS